MSSTTRQLSGIMGVAVTPPTQTGFTSNSMQIYASDAEFLAANPSPTEGMFYWNSTEKLVRQYNGTTFQYDKTAFSTQTDSTSTGADQDIAPEAGNQIIRYTGGSLTSIRGIDPTVQKQVFLINDQATNGITLRNQSAGATAANRIITGNGQDFTIRTNQAVGLTYDTAISRWRLSTAASVRAVEAFASDAGFGLAHNPPVIGDRYWNTTNLVLRQYDGSVWSNNKVLFSTQNNTSLSGSTADLVPAFDQIIKVSNVSLFGIRGISAAIQKLIILINGTGQNLTLKNEDATATAATRIITGTGADISMNNDTSVILEYDDHSSRWRIAGGSGGGGLTTSVQTSGFTASAGKHYLTDTTAGPFSAVLEAGAPGAVVKFTDSAEMWGTNNFTIIPAPTQRIDNLAPDEWLICDVIRGWVELSWNGSYWAFNSLASTQVAEASATSPGIVTTGTQSFAGNKTFNDGVKLDDAAGQSTLAYYSEDDTSMAGCTFQGNLGGSASGGINIKVTRIGRQVTLDIPSISSVIPTGGSSFLLGNKLLPTWARPAVGKSVVTMAHNNNAWGTTPGYLFIPITGELQFYRDNLSTPYTNSANAGWYHTQITYTV